MKKPPRTKGKEGRTVEKSTPTKPAPRMYRYLCQSCREKLEAARYECIETERAPRFGQCQSLAEGCCPYKGALTEYQIRKKYYTAPSPRTGGGERARAK